LTDSDGAMVGAMPPVNQAELLNRSTRTVACVADTARVALHVAAVGVPLGTHDDGSAAMAIDSKPVVGTDSTAPAAERRMMGGSRAPWAQGSNAIGTKWRRPAPCPPPLPLPAHPTDRGKPSIGDGDADCNRHQNGQHHEDSAPDAGGTAAPLAGAVVLPLCSLHHFDGIWRSSVGRLIAVHRIR